MGHPLWPLFDLRVRTPTLVLRLPTDEDLVTLAALAQAGIHEPDEMPFGYPWSILPSPAFERGFVQYHWSLRANWKPDDWGLDLLVEQAALQVELMTGHMPDVALMRSAGALALSG